ncbi:MAG: response regulator, partial [Angelakisella sp.]
MIDCIIVEDELILRQGLVLTTDWEDLGCRLVGEAADGDSGLKLIDRCKPNLIITDIRMPGVDGLELIRQSRSLCNAVYLIMSGYNDFEYARRALQLGVMDFISKPIDEEEFAAAIRMAVLK